eukprot:4515368-Alexandrium_andersonii.AAC.1
MLPPRSCRTLGLTRVGLAAWARPRPRRPRRAGVGVGPGLLPTGRAPPAVSLARSAAGGRN